MQKFKRGNLVRVVKTGCTYKGNLSVDKEAVILGSYADLYGGTNIYDYSIIFTDDGNECAWFDKLQLILLDEGGEHLIEKAKETQAKTKAKNRDMKYVSEKIETESISAESILFLFEMLGIHSSFNHNGEYFILFEDWRQIKHAFLWIKHAKTIEQAKEAFTPEVLPIVNVEKVFEAFKSVE